VKKVFIDANIILDLLDSTRTCHSISKKVFEDLIDQNLQIVISEDILTTIYYIVKNKRAVLEFFEIITDQWEIVSFGNLTIVDAINLCKEDSSLDFEDVIQSLSAKESGCSLIITNDRNFFSCGVPIMGAEEFVAGDSHL
jgi:predicted nucleic acid-binding protein